MIDCLILGDSIAVGTHMARPECVAYATSGINTTQFNKKYPQPFNGKVVVISLGSNDHKYIKTEKELFKLRERVQAETVYWILPAGNSKASEIPIVRIQEHVESIAEMYGDWIVRIPSLSKDGVHPTRKGYRRIGEIVE
jgi:lysophospholipase L1-like esterase